MGPRRLNRSRQAQPWPGAVRQPKLAIRGTGGSPPTGRLRVGRKDARRARPPMVPRRTPAGKPKASLRRLDHRSTASRLANRTSKSLTRRSQHSSSRAGRCA